MEENRREITITQNIQGIIVFAKACGRYYDDWLLIIDKVIPEYNFATHNPEPMIYTHISMTLNGDTVNLEDAPKWGWVNSMGFKFYLPTTEEMDIIKNTLRKKGYKFIKPLNKIKKI